MSAASLDVARYKRLAVRSADTWQGGLFRLPMWIQECEDDPPYRPIGAFWRSARTGLIWILIEPQPRTAKPELAVRALLEHQTGPRPRGLLETPGVTVEHVRRFAEAACEFYTSEPWEALQPEDLVAVDVPGLDPEMRYLVVTGTSRETP